MKLIVKNSLTLEEIYVGNQDLGSGGLVKVLDGVKECNRYKMKIFNCSKCHAGPRGGKR